MRTIQSPRSKLVSRMIDLRFFMVLQKGGKEWRYSNRMGQGRSCSYDCFLLLILVEKSVVKLWALESATLGWYEKVSTWGMKLKWFPFKLRSFWYIVYFILKLLSKANSFGYNLLDVSIQSVYLEISYLSTMELYTDLDLLLKFVCFFRKERLYIDRSND